MVPGTRTGLVQAVVGYRSWNCRWRRGSEWWWYSFLFLLHGLSSYINLPDHLHSLYHHNWLTDIL